MEIGIIQSRLSPINNNNPYQCFPLDYWKVEFSLASQIGFNHIEWIFDNHSFDPLQNNPKLITTVGLQNNLHVKAICADIFMHYSFGSSNKDQINFCIKTLNMLISKAYEIGVKIIVIPCLEKSNLNDPKMRENFIKNIQPCLDIAGTKMVTICLESDLRAPELAKFIKGFNHPKVKVCYDTGNPLSWSEYTKETLDHIGEYVAHIHLKDKIFKKRSNSFIGQGNVNFNYIKSWIEQTKYDGALTLQCARDRFYNIEYIKNQYKIIKGFLC